MNEFKPVVEPTENDFKLVRKQFTTIQHPRVVGCGHRLDMSRKPRHSNCQYCYFTFFQNHAEVTKQCDEMFKEDPRLITQLQGVKFTKRFTQFMSTLAQWKEAQERNGTES